MQPGVQPHGWGGLLTKSCIYRHLSKTLRAVYCHLHFHPMWTPLDHGTIRDKEFWARGGTKEKVLVTSFQTLDFSLPDQGLGSPPKRVSLILTIPCLHHPVPHVSFITRIKSSSPHVTSWVPSSPSDMRSPKVPGMSLRFQMQRTSTSSFVDTFLS